MAALLAGKLRDYVLVQIVISVLGMARILLLMVV